MDIDDYQIDLHQSSFETDQLNQFMDYSVTFSTPDLTNITAYLKETGGSDPYQVRTLLPLASSTAQSQAPRPHPHPPPPPHRLHPCVIITSSTPFTPLSSSGAR